MNTEILFHLEEGGTALPDGQEKPLIDWIEQIIIARGGVPGDINYIFCGDNYLHQLNVAYLAHDTLTDIITFPYAHFPTVSGDLFISTERVDDNAKGLKISFLEELHRVVIHGVLHLCGQADKTPEEAEAMRQLENWALGLRPVELLPA